MTRRSKLIAMFAAAIGAVTWINTATAQNYPIKPIRWVLGPAPDVLPRLVSQKLAELWGHQVIVDQRPGAGGAIAAELVARASPDGYTWLMSPGAFYVHVHGVSVPIKTPRALLIKLNGDIRRVLAFKEVQERMVAAGLDPADMTLDQFDAFVRKDVKLYQRIVKESKINID